MDNNEPLSTQKLTRTNFNPEREKFREELNRLAINHTTKNNISTTPPAKPPRQIYNSNILFSTSAPLIQNGIIPPPPPPTPPPPSPSHSMPGTIKKTWDAVQVNTNDQSNEYIQRPKNRMTEIHISFAEELKKKLDEINNKNTDSKPLDIIYDNESEEKKVKTTEEELDDEYKNLENLLKELSIGINALNNNTIKAEDKEEDEEQNKGLKPDQEIMISSELNCDNSTDNNTEAESVNLGAQKRVQFNINNTQDINNTRPKTIEKRKFSFRDLINGFSCIKPVKD